MIEIEKNVPLMPLIKQSKYPFARMQIGDSFFVKLADASKNSVYSAKTKASTVTGFKFTIRADNDNAGVRVWRVA